MDTTVRNILIFFALMLLFYLLQVLSTLIIPLVLALLLAMIFQPLMSFLIRKKFPKWLILPLISILSLAVLFGLINIVISTSYEILSQKDYMLSRLSLRLDDGLNTVSAITRQNIDKNYVTNEIISLYKSGWITRTAGSLAGSISSFSGSFVMFVLYYIFILAGLSNYKKYLNYVIKDNKKAHGNIDEIQKSINKYMVTKVIINLMSSAIIVSICLLFGIKFAIFWGLLAFIFNFIPNFGSIFSVAMPILMGLVQFDSYKMMFILLIVMIAIQFTIGNFIEPKIIGNSLRINTVTVLFGLVFWGYIWGMAGMILSVPLMVIVKLSLEHSSSLSLVSRIMGYPETKV